MAKKLQGILVLFMVLPVLLLSGCGDATSGNLVDAQKIVDYHDSKYDDLEVSGELVDGVRLVEIRAYQFFFEPTTIVVNKGDKVRLVIHSEDVPHGFEIEGFNIPGYDIDTKIRPGRPLELEFDADRIGVWEFICTIYCGFGHSDMKGTFVIR